MRELGRFAERLAASAGGRALLSGGAAERRPGALRAGDRLRRALDVRRSCSSGCAGEREDGGRHAAAALGAGAWGVLVAPEHARAALQRGGEGVVLAHEDPLAGMQALAAARGAAELVGLGARVILAVTGSTGKTSTKDILAALLARSLRTAASPANLNTEIGLPLALLAAPADTQALVLEMAMRGSGQIAQLTAIAQPARRRDRQRRARPPRAARLARGDRGREGRADRGPAGADARAPCVPAGERLLEPHLRADLRTITFGEGGDVTAARSAKRADREAW